MLKNTKYAQCLTLKSDDLGNQLINPNSVQITLDDAKLFYQEKLQDGYNIYNVTASGGFTALSAAAPGKWLCVFTASPTATYDCPTSILSGTGSVAHTDVIITSLIVDNVYSPIEITSVSISGFTDTGNYGTLSIKYCTLTVTTSGLIGVFNITYDNAVVTWNQSEANRYNANKTISNTKFIIDKSHGLYITSAHTLTIQNFIVIGTANAVSFDIVCSNVSLAKIDCENTYISLTGTSSYFGLSRSTSGYGIKLTNVYATTSAGVGLTIVGNVLYTESSYNNILYVSINTPIINVTGTSVSDLVIGYPSTVNQYISGAYASLDTTLCKSVTASTLYLNANISQVKRSIRGSFGTIRRQYYNLQFLDNQVLDDSLKNFDDQDRLLINRSDILTATAAISADKIKGFNWTDSTGAVLKYPRIDESFLLLCEYGSYTHVLAWHKGRLNKTIYTDYWPTALYTPVLAFQIWEMPEEVEYRNVWNINDSPIAGAIQVQDITSKVVL